jgi:hypothetical protein
MTTRVTFQLWPLLPTLASGVTLRGHVDIAGVRYVIDAWCVGENKAKGIAAHFEGSVTAASDADRQQALDL